MSRQLTLAAIAALGCGHPAQVATPPGHVAPADASIVVDAAPIALDDDLPRLAARAIAMYQELARALAGTNECPAATTKLQAIEARYADVIAANRRVLHGGRDKIQQLHAALEPHQADFDAAAQAIVHSSTMTNCSQDAAFARAIDNLVGETS